MHNYDNKNPSNITGNEKVDAATL